MEVGSSPWTKRSTAASVADGILLPGDQHGQVVDAHFSERRNAAAAQIFLERATAHTSLTPERILNRPARCCSPTLRVVLPRASSITVLSGCSNDALERLV